ncbi:hypothetical protein QO009_003023 [Brevibacillus aydinogluensis]|uniref:DUF2325 domain-containing protein n=1 Tax=Brevibacillus aydinogluensis TaxID=927786 RepID=UPI0028934241|nr:DUF2325 domain-containing protein [Brevibacillus aydinogluensis]MDT3417128.1 hypothetical protein [Brevibacillus aydinogluensis]
MKTIAIIGGSQKTTFERIAKENGFKVLFTDAKLKCRKNGYQEIRSIIKKADCVVVLRGACSHGSAEAAREFAKELGKPISFVKNGFGATGAIQLATSMSA